MQRYIFISIKEFWRLGCLVETKKGGPHVKNFETILVEGKRQHKRKKNSRSEQEGRKERGR
jgi:hypothetical protein